MENESSVENPFYKDIFDAKEKYKIYPSEKFDILSYVPVNSILQKGPQCGLVAIQMIIKTIDPHYDIHVENIFERAKISGYTLNGEMFSTNNLAKLVTANYLSIKKVSVHYGKFNEKCVDHLKLGGLMIVPYDADGNHAPSSKKGHKAHWAVVNGLVQCGEKTFVTARHGKSKHLAIWNVEELSESNSQLEEFSPDRNASNVPYIVPKGGLGGPEGLKNSYILISL